MSGDDTARRLGLGMGAGDGSVWAAPSAEALAEAIPGLRVLEVAGRGGMGVVYRAEQTNLGRLVAVKVLAPAGFVVAGTGSRSDPLAEERFEREARVLAGLAHPHVLQIYDAGRLSDGTRYLVTEWAEGGDLARMAGGRAQPPERVVEWVAQIAAALDAAHARGVVHRDLKPANVLVRADGRLALGDFGLARAEGPGFTTALTLSGVAYGTADYMAPEQTGGPDAAAISPATDVYALGVLTYQLLTGRVPRGVFEPASTPAGVSVAVDAVIATALAHDPKRRTRTAGEFAGRLAAAIGRGGGSRRRRWVAILACGACAAGATLAYVNGVTRRGSMEPAATGRWGAAGPSASRAAEEPETRPSAVSNVAVAGLRWILPEVEPGRDRASGGWERAGAELRSDAGVCALRLPVRLPANFHYDVKVEFTRLSGRNSVGVFLPTSAGVGVFELDAWDAGLGGIQMINDQDMRAHGEHFPGALQNGERQSVTLEVRGARVTAIWKGRAQRSWDLAGRRFTNPWLWDAGGDMRLGLCSWKSPTLFHRVGFQTMGE